jgi:hypothetical protein
MDVEQQLSLVESPQKATWEDIDANDHLDPSMVSDYVTGKKIFFSFPFLLFLFLFFSLFLHPLSQ